MKENLTLENLTLGFTNEQIEYLMNNNHLAEGGKDLVIRMLLKQVKELKSKIKENKEK